MGGGERVTWFRIPHKSLTQMSSNHTYTLKYQWAKSHTYIYEKFSLSPQICFAVLKYRKAAICVLCFGGRETGSCFVLQSSLEPAYVAQTHLKLMVRLLPQFPKC